MAFAEALVRGDWKAAYEMLAPSLRDDLQPEDLQFNYQQMTSYWEEPSDSIDVAHVDDEASVCPRRGDSDIGWAYVAIYSQGGSCQEAVAVRVVREHSREAIAEVIWGRP